MCCHYHIGIERIDGVRRKLCLFQLVICLVYKRQPRVTVNISITVTREMLAGRDNALIFKPCYIPCTKAADYIGIRGERTDIDNGI